MHSLNAHQQERQVQLEQGFGSSHDPQQKSRESFPSTTVARDSGPWAVISDAIRPGRVKWFLVKSAHLPFNA